MNGYWIGLVNVTNADAYAEYGKLAGPAIAKHGGKFLARGGKTKTLEGPEHARVVVVEFPSYEVALKCYNSPEYHAAHAKQNGAAARNITVVEGLA